MFTASLGLVVRSAEMEPEKQLQQAAIAYLRQRGYSTSSPHAREIKINEMLARDSNKRMHYALHVPLSAATSSAAYEEGYKKLCAWMIWVFLLLLLLL